MKKIWIVAKKNRGKRKRKEAMAYLKYLPKEVAILFLLGGIFFGINLTIGCLYLEAHVDISETEQMTALYLSYERPPEGLNIPSGAIVFFSNTEKKYINRICFGYTNWDLLNKIKPETEMYLLLHPNSHHILEMKVDDEYILKFENSQKYPWWLLVMEYGLISFCYGMAMYAIIKIIRKEIV